MFRLACGNSLFLFRTAAFLLTCYLLPIVPAAAQVGYGVDANGSLFHFPLNDPTSVTTVGNTGITPNAIDFRPGTSQLFAIDVGETTTQLYTINIATGAASPVGAGFPTTVAGSYDLSGNNAFGFDFNPSTLQLNDGSMRIRLVSNNSRANLRLNSLTGAVAAVDTQLAIGTNAPFVDGIAYINNIPNAGTFATKLFDMDVRNNKLYEQTPPNNGSLVEVGAFGVTITTQPGIGFDVYTTPGDADPGLGGDAGWAVVKRPDAPVGNPGIYLLYNVNLATGQLTNGAAVGGLNTPRDFSGGFSILPVPEPASACLATAVVIAASTLRRRRVR